MIVKIKKGEKVMLLVDDREFWKVSAVGNGGADLLKMGTKKEVVTAYENRPK